MNPVATRVTAEPPASEPRRSDSTSKEAGGKFASHLESAEQSHQAAESSQESEATEEELEASIETEAGTSEATEADAANIEAEVEFGEVLEAEESEDIGSGDGESAETSEGEVEIRLELVKSGAKIRPSVAKPGRAVAEPAKAHSAAALPSATTSEAPTETTEVQPGVQANAPNPTQNAAQVASVAAARAQFVPSELAEEWAARATANRARVVVGTGDDRVSVLVALEKEGVRVVAEAAAIETAEFLTHRSRELERALARVGRELIELRVDGDQAETASSPPEPGRKRPPIIA